MAKKPFKVSARTARLIGRENVSNVEGALIELVKNCYDADSPICILYFNIFHDSIPDILDKNTYLDYVNVSKESGKTSFIQQSYSYQKNENNYKLKNDLSNGLLAELEYFLKSKNSLFIIDQGEGMTEKVIDEHWMTIGTNNKLNDVITPSGRIKAGAKGIGRFALDRLGSYCHMITLPKGKKIGYDWSVDWEDFEIEGAIIGDVNADFSPRRNLDYKKEIITLTNNDKVIKTILSSKLKFENGTILHISALRDWWSETNLNDLFENLQNLSPPGNTQKFHIEMISKTHPSRFGKVANDEYTDYDYKVNAKVNADKSVKIDVYRNELQVNKLDKDLFKRKAMTKEPYDFPTFKKGSYNINTSVNELLPWLADSSISGEVDRLKEFEFLFYFMKQAATQKDRDRFAYRSFNRNERLDWFRKFGGIKVFRDNFRVRPYGETDNASFDWLLLGDRQAKSPAGITKKGGGWRVAPNQVAGVVHISRLANLNFEDKSSREGFQENETFYIFKQLLIEIIHQFEMDRHEVMREMDLLKREKEEEEEAKSRAEELLQEEEEKEDNEDDEKTEDDYKEERNTFKSAYSSVKAELDDAEEQIQILSALATTGLIVTSFAHEFPSFKNKLIRNTNYLERALDNELDRKKIEKKTDAKHNPFNHIANLRKAHEGITHWLDLSLAAVRKDKRSSKPIDIQTYLEEFKNETWKEVLGTRNTTLKIITITEEQLKLKAFIIDIDSIFNNLLINSFDAFDRKGFSGDRLITIAIDVIYLEEDEKDYLEIDYSDSGPGLAKSIKNPYNILRRGYTTKVNSKNEEIGTGLGMWIINEAVSYYGGTIEIFKPKQGFQLKIRIPYSKKNES